MTKGKNWKIKLGIFLMIFSGVFFAATFVIPLFNLPTKTKVIASTTSLVLMEVVFWSGGLLVGKELFTIAGPGLVRRRNDDATGYAGARRGQGS